MIFCMDNATSLISTFTEKVFETCRVIIRTIWPFCLELVIVMSRGAKIYIQWGQKSRNICLVRSKIVEFITNFGRVKIVFIINYIRDNSVIFFFNGVN